jgi:uncharacterized membrane protein YbhN (UPF0104 family)
MGRKAFAVLLGNWLWGLAIAGLAARVVAVNPVMLGQVFRQVDRRIVVLMVPTTLAIFIVRGIGWWFALRRIGIEISVARAVVILFAGKPMVFLPAGDLGRVAVLEATGATRGHNVGEVAATVAFQELGFLALLGVPLIPAVVVQPALAPLLLFLVLLLGIILAVLLWEPAYLRAVALVERIPFLRRFDRELRHIRPAFLKLFEARTILGVLISDALGVAVTFFLFELALNAVGATGVGLLQASFSYAVAYVVSGLAFTPVGLGAYEGIITGFMVLQGVPPWQGAAAALLYRGFNDVFMGLVGLAFLFSLRKATSRNGVTERYVRPSGVE